jgi:biopolymer transport protein ExbD
MFRFEDQDQTIGGMETAAFADIIFLLLIFFLLSSSFILPTGIPVNPPKSETAVAAREQPVVVTLTRTGEVYVDEDKVPFADLATTLGARLSSAPIKSVVVRGDEAVSLGKLVEVLDMARSAGAEKLAIATEQKHTRRR